MSKGQTKKTREAAGNRRKLTRAEKKQIAEAIRKAKGDGKARTAQQTIPYLAMYPDGICKVTEKRYSCLLYTSMFDKPTFSEYYSSLFSQSVGFFHYSRNFMTSWILPEKGKPPSVTATFLFSG